VILIPEEKSFSIIQVSKLSRTVIADNCEKSLVESLTLITISLTSCQETKAGVETYDHRSTCMYMHGKKNQQHKIESTANTPKPCLSSDCPWMFLYSKCFKHKNTYYVILMGHGSKGKAKTKWPKCMEAVALKSIPFKQLSRCVFNSISGEI